MKKSFISLILATAMALTSAVSLTTVANAGAGDINYINQYHFNGSSTTTDVFGPSGNYEIVAGTNAGLVSGDKIVKVTGGTTTVPMSLFAGYGWGSNSAVKHATFEFEVYKTGTNDELNIIPTADDRYGMRIKNTGAVVAINVVSGSWNEVELTGSPAVTANRWHRFAIEYDMTNGTAKLYMDDTLIDTNTTMITSGTYVPCDFTIQSKSTTNDTYLNNVLFYEGGYVPGAKEFEIPEEIPSEAPTVTPTETPTEAPVPSLMPNPDGAIEVVHNNGTVTATGEGVEVVYTVLITSDNENFTDDEIWYVGQATEGTLLNAAAGFAIKSGAPAGTYIMHIGYTSMNAGMSTAARQVEFTIGESTTEAPTQAPTEAPTETPEEFKVELTSTEVDVDGNITVSVNVDNIINAQQFTLFFVEKDSHGTLKSITAQKVTADGSYPVSLPKYSAASNYVMYAWTDTLTPVTPAFSVRNQ